MKLLILLTILALLTGCSSLVTSSAALAVSLYSQKIERDSRRYKKLDPCFVEGKPGAFMLAESIVYGSPISRNYQNILNPELHDDWDPPPPHHIAYAFYVIAERIGDVRAKKRKEMLHPYFQEGEAKDIEEFVDYKYLQSHLTKCFSVPPKHKKRIRARDLI